MPAVSHAQAMLDEPRRAYLVMHAEAEFDFANPVAARAALERADLVVAMSPFRHGSAYADVLLPISPFTETSGTFVNCEGRAQSFRGVVQPRGETRPGWKVLRVLGSMLGLPDFAFDTSEQVRDSVLPEDEDEIARLLDNRTDVAITPACARRRSDRTRRRRADLFRGSAGAPRRVAAADA